MSEPEDVLIEGAYLATRLTRDLWRRWRPSDDARSRLDDHRRRLELIVSALYGGVPEIVAAEPPPAPTLLARLAARGSASPSPTAPLATTDGRRIFLPPALDGPPAGAAGRYRLLALEQAARAARHTRSLVPADPLERDLFLLAEAAVVDRELAARFPALAPALRASRAAVRRDRRPPPGARGLAVEQLVLTVLASDPTAIPPDFPADGSPGASRAWAERQAASIRRLGGRYRAPMPVPHWGGPPRTGEAPLPSDPADAREADHPTRVAHVRRLIRRPNVRPPRDGEDEDESQAGTWIVRADDPAEKVEDPMGLQRPADRDDEADAAELAELVAELPDARLIRRPGPVAEILESEVPLPRAARPAGSVAPPVAIAYPEWDWRTRAYRMPGAIVREREGVAGDLAWVDRVRVARAGLVRRVRRDFERLRPRRLQVRRQPDGDDVDIDAWVERFADVQAASPLDGRLYVATRAARRDAAIALLIDGSASTDAWAGGGRVIDIEKEALLVIAEALAALGDPHAILSFASQGPERVGIGVIKRFGEPPGAAVRRRIAGLEPDGYTRLGAAIRHVTTLLARRAAGRRLLMILSDGRPNDVDAYDGRYGVEDTRQAVVEARRLGVYPFCLTVDRDAARYGSRVFGPGHYAVVTNPARLPLALAGLLTRLLRA